jgi:hypothetical protein
MTAASAKSLFRATKAKRPALGRGLMDLHDQTAPQAPRRTDDFYPTGQPDAIRALMARDGARIRACGSVWEPAVGDGALAREMESMGLPVHGSDIVDRGWTGTELRSFFDFSRAPAPAIITNPPFNLINARDGHGAWLRHTLAMPDWTYCALLLSWDWPAARANGLGALLDAQPFSWCYLMRWKLDFTGEGNPAQRNAWFVWDRTDPRGPGCANPHPDFRFLDRDDARQGNLFGGSQ